MDRVEVGGCKEKSAVFVQCVDTSIIIIIVVEQMYGFRLFLMSIVM